MSTVFRIAAFSPTRKPNGIFVLNRLSILSFFVLNSTGVNRKEFRYLLLSYTGYGFGLNVLNRVRV